MKRGIIRVAVRREGKVALVDLVEMVLLSGVPFGLLFGLLFVPAVGLQWGCVAAVIAGPCFGLASAGFVLCQSAKLKGGLPLGPDEKIIKEGSANRIVSGQATGGWLCLTNKRLIFKAHAVNWTKEEFAADLDQIKDAKPCLAFRVVPNGLQVTTSAGDPTRFVVFGRWQWSAQIARAKAAG